MTKEDQRCCIDTHEYFCCIFLINTLLLMGIVYLISCYHSQSSEHSSSNEISFDRILEIGENLDNSVDPCVDFYQYACGHSFEEERFANERDSPLDYSVRDSERTIDQLLLVLNHEELNTKSSAVEFAHRVFQSCLEGKSSKEAHQKAKRLLSNVTSSKKLENMITESFRSGYKLFFAFEIEEDNLVDGLRLKLLPSQQTRSTRKSSGYYQHLFQVFQVERNISFEDLVEFESEIIDPIFTRRRSRKRKRIQLSQLVKHSGIDWVQIFRQLSFEVDGREVIFIEDLEMFQEMRSVLNSSSNKQLIQMYAEKVLMDQMCFSLGPQCHRWNVTEDEELNFSVDCILQLEPYFGRAFAKLYFDEVLQGQSSSLNLAEKFIIQIQQQTLMAVKKMAWIDDETQQRLLHKLESLRIHLPFWVTKDNLDDFAHINTHWSNFFDYMHDIRRYVFHLKVDQYKQIRTFVPSWPGRALDPRAIYSPEKNSFYLLLPLLGGSFFSHAYPYYLNYGGLGHLVARHLVQAIDLHGSLYGARGEKADLWSSQTKANFLNISQPLVNLYTGDFEFDDDERVKIDGNASLVDNFADIVALKIAFDAFNSTWIKDKAERISIAAHFTDEQMFFLAYASTKCILYPTNAKLRGTIPNKLRVNLVLSQMKEFSEAFSCPTALDGKKFDWTSWPSAIEMRSTDLTRLEVINNSTNN